MSVSDSKPASGLHRLTAGVRREGRVFAGVEYDYDEKTNMIFDPDDGLEMGEWDSEKNEIRFEEEETEERHKADVNANEL